MSSTHEDIDSDDSKSDKMDTIEESQQREEQALEEYNAKIIREKQHQLLLNHQSDKKRSSTNQDDDSDDSQYDRMDTFEASQKREDEAFDEFTLKIQREKQRQEFLKNEKLKQKIWSQDRKDTATKRGIFST